MDEARFRDWIGLQEQRVDTLVPWPAAALTAAIDRNDAPAPSEPLPPFWHHLYFLPVVRAEETGPDGHPERGGFLPPVSLPRRMWAGGRLRWHRQLVIGSTIERVSTIRSIESKRGRSGPLVFVMVEHAFHDGDGVAMVEEHDIVYREAPKTDISATTIGAPLADGDWPWRRDWRPDAVMLFRYSALTYNGHRIHYDHPYVTEIEGYPELIVHGPLIATLLLDLVRREAPRATVREFAFRATAPAFAGEQLGIVGRPVGDRVELLARTGAGTAAMHGTVVLA